MDLQSLQSTLYSVILVPNERNHQQMGKLLTWIVQSYIIHVQSTAWILDSETDVMSEVWVHTEISDLWLLVSSKSKHSL